MNNSPVKVRTQFRWTHADSNPMWTVIESRGRGTWIARINDDDLDYAGVEAAFTTKQIQSAVAFENVLNQAMDESVAFYNNLTPGGIVHYSNCFNQYVLCKVMPDKTLMPIALVGDWRKYDLPFRRNNGEIYNGYHADKIFKKEAMQPHASNVWECPQFAKVGKIDPITLTAIDLSVPALTDEESNKARLWQAVDQIRAITGNRGGENNPMEILTRVSEALQLALKKA